MTDIRGMVLDLLGLYGERVGAVEALVDAADRMSGASAEGFSVVVREREQLNARLGEMLARNCSLRKKDFDRLMAAALEVFAAQRAELEGEKARADSELRHYLSAEKERALLLKQRLLDSQGGEGPELALDGLRNSLVNDAQRILLALRDFRRKVERFTQEQHAFNKTLRELVDRGDHLKLEDVRKACLGRAEAS